MSTSNSNGNGISERRLLANRANAQKSTGPRTPEGKARSAQNAQFSTGPRTAEGKHLASLNATTHALRARLTPSALVPPSEQEDFTILQDALRQQLKPQTPMHELLFQRLALLAWKLRRHAAAEAAFYHLTHQQAREDAQARNAKLLQKHEEELAHTLALLLHAQDPHNPKTPLDTLHRYESATQRAFDKTLAQYQNLPIPEDLPISEDPNPEESEASTPDSPSRLCAFFPNEPNPTPSPSPDHESQLAGAPQVPVSDSTELPSEPNPPNPPNR